MLRLKFVTTNRHVFESEFDGKALCAACATAQVSRVLLPFIRRQPVDLNARLQAWGWRFSTIQMQPFKWWKAGTSNLHWLGIFKNSHSLGPDVFCSWVASIGTICLSLFVNQAICLCVIIWLSFFVGSFVFPFSNCIVLHSVQQVLKMSMPLGRHISPMFFAWFPRRVSPKSLEKKSIQKHVLNHLDPCGVFLASFFVDGSLMFHMFHDFPGHKSSARGCSTLTGGYISLIFHYPGWKTILSLEWWLEFQK